VLVVADVVGDLALERGLHQPLRELGEQAAVTGQLQTTLTGPPDQTIEQLLVDGVEPVRAVGLSRTSSSRSTGRCSGITSVIGCYLHDRGYTVVSIGPVPVRLCGRVRAGAGREPRGRCG
jgi:hypothetical protein